jgi:hypothetical protein
MEDFSIRSLRMCHTVVTRDVFKMGDILNFSKLALFSVNVVETISICLSLCKIITTIFTSYVINKLRDQFDISDYVLVIEVIMQKQFL